MWAVTSEVAPVCLVWLSASVSGEPTTKMAKLIVNWTYVNSVNHVHVVDGMHMGATWWMQLNDLCSMAMRVIATVTVATCLLVVLVC